MLHRIYIVRYKINFELSSYFTFHQTHTHIVTIDCKLRVVVICDKRVLISLVIDNSFRIELFYGWCHREYWFLHLIGSFLRNWTFVLSILNDYNKTNLGIFENIKINYISIISLSCDRQTRKYRQTSICKIYSKSGRFFALPANIFLSSQI